MNKARYNPVGSNVRVDEASERLASAITGDGFKSPNMEQLKAASEIHQKLKVQKIRLPWIRSTSSTFYDTNSIHQGLFKKQKKLNSDHPKDWEAQVGQIIVTLSFAGDTWAFNAPKWMKRETTFKPGRDAIRSLDWDWRLLNTSSVEKAKEEIERWIYKQLLIDKAIVDEALSIVEETDIGNQENKHG